MTAPIPRDLPDLPAIRRPHAPLPSAVPAAAVVAPARRPVAAVLRLLIVGTAAAAVTLALSLGSSRATVLSLFAIQSTIVLAVVTLVSARRAWSARRPLPASVTGAALLYVTITALMYHLLLTDEASHYAMTATTAAPTTWQSLTNHLLHTVIPAAAVLDWLLLTPPGRLRLRRATTWLLYPLAYLAFTFARGELITPGSPDHYLYPFLNAAAHGYRHSLANALLLTLSVYALAALLIALDHTRPDPTRHRLKTGFRLQPPVG